MNTFRIGDRVEFIARTGEGCRSAIRGDVGVVLGIRKGGVNEPDLLHVVVAARGKKYVAYSIRFKRLRPKMLENE